MPPRAFVVCEETGGKDWVTCIDEAAAMHPTQVATFTDRVVRFEREINGTQEYGLKGLRCFFVSISPTAANTMVDLAYLLPWFQSSEENHDSKHRMTAHNSVALFNPMVDYNLVCIPAAVLRSCPSISQARDDR
jgi:hypothetical protein